MSETTAQPSPNRNVAEALAGFMAAAAVFIALMGVAYRPVRLTMVAALLALVATAMSRNQPKLVPVAWAMIGIGFVVGVTLQVLTHHPLF